MSNENSFHDLRHSAATLLLSEGIRPKIVLERLGHSRVAITLDLYSHVTPTMQHQAVEAMDKLLALGPSSFQIESKKWWAIQDLNL